MAKLQLPGDAVLQHLLIVVKTAENSERWLRVGPENLQAKLPFEPPQHGGDITGLEFFATIINGLVDAMQRSRHLRGFRSSAKAGKIGQQKYRQKRTVGVLRP
jgi:hypothetical protein